MILTKSRPFHVGDPIWLSILTARKLDPRWEGEWTVHAVKSPVNLEICDGRRKVVHVNRLRYRSVPQQPKAVSSPSPLSNCKIWSPPSTDHVTLPPVLPSPPRQYPQREMHPPNRLTY